MQRDPFQIVSSNFIQQEFTVDGGPIAMRQYACSPGRARISGLTRHALLVNSGEPISVTCTSELNFPSAFNVERLGAIGIVPAGKSAEVSWNNDISLSVLLLDPDYITRLLGNSPDLRPRFDIADPIFSDLCSRLVSAIMVPHFPERTYVESLVVLCMESLSRNTRSIPDDQPGKGRLSPRQLQHVIAFAHDSMQLDIGLVDLANLVHLSAYHFGRLFKQTIGLSPYQYILQMRIEYAKKLIIEKAGPLGEIAYQLNFSDQAHFSNAFRKATGVSPRQYQHGQLAVI